jgi:hypothetical protein
VSARHKPCFSAPLLEAQEAEIRLVLPVIPILGSSLLALVLVLEILARTPEFELFVSDLQHLEHDREHEAQDDDDEHCKLQQGRAS